MIRRTEDTGKLQAGGINAGYVLRFAINTIGRGVMILRLACEEKNKCRAALIRVCCVNVHRENTQPHVYEQRRQNGTNARSTSQAIQERKRR